jgi:hypothetical protein
MQEKEGRKCVGNKKNFACWTEHHVQEVKGIIPHVSGSSILDLYLMWTQNIEEELNISQFRTYKYKNIPLFR